MSEPIVVKLACCNIINCATITLKPNVTTVLHGMARFDYLLASASSRALSTVPSIPHVRSSS